MLDFHAFDSCQEGGFGALFVFRWRLIQRHDVIDGLARIVIDLAEINMRLVRVNLYS
jgi:hypothetical protein